MMRIRCRTCAGGLLLALLTLAGVMPKADAAQPESTAGIDLATQPVTNAPQPIGPLLKRLASMAPIAGNLGDVYDNRDRGHSMLRVEQFPQLRRLVYSEAELQARRDWGLATTIQPYVLVGNSSTSAVPWRGGSNPRGLYASSRGLDLAWQQYTFSNLYVYPEHQDYDWGIYGFEHRGDHYWVNTPYLLISRGSSGSDSPFMHAALYTLAAFKPEVKQQLYARRLLMPTLQMILRRTLKDIRSDEDYLSGKAHPPAIGGERVDAVAMVSMANKIDLDKLPPLAAVQVVEESASLQGRDYYLPQQPERWADTPAVISRIFRGPRPHYRMVLDAGQSVDPNDRHLTYHWRVLRGDPERITIKPLDEAGRRVEIVVPFQNHAWPAPDDPKVPTRRVDVGLFVHNGEYYSPPAFVCIYMPAHQRVTLDAQDRVHEMGYGAVATAYDTGGLDLHGDRWVPLLNHVLSDEQTARLLRRLMPADRQAALQRVSDHRKHLDDTLANSERLLSEVQARLAEEPDPASNGQLQQALRLAEDFQAKSKRAVEDGLLDWREPGSGRTARELLVEGLADLFADPVLFFGHQQDLQAVGAMPDGFLQRLEGLGIVRQDEEGRWTMTPLSSSPEELTVFEDNQLRGLRGAVLHELTGRIVEGPHDAWPDARVALRQRWRDVYHYDAEGNMTGWTRFIDGETQRFTPDGWLIPEGADASGSAQAVKVDYVVHGDDLWTASTKMVVPTAEPTASRVSSP